MQVKKVQDAEVWDEKADAEWRDEVLSEWYSSSNALWVKVSDLGWTDNPNKTSTKDYEKSKWWCASAVSIDGNGCLDSSKSLESTKQITEE